MLQLETEDATHDFEIQNHGSIYLLIPITSQAREWVEQYLPEDTQTFGSGYAIGHQFIGNVANGIQGDGLTIS